MISLKVIDYDSLIIISFISSVYLAWDGSIQSPVIRLWICCKKRVYCRKSVDKDIRSSGPQLGLESSLYKGDSM